MNWTEAEAVELIEGNVAALREGLAVWARHMAARYNGPVYLLGSTLHNPAPRDTDIRIVVEDHEFAARYDVPLHHFEELPEHHPIRQRSSIVGGNFCKWDEDGPSQRWIDDVAKFNAHLSTKHKRNFDVQVVPDSWWRNRIYPEPILLAQPNGRWWFYSSIVPDPASRVSPPAAATEEP